MPTYEYACTVCDGRLEVVQRFTDDPLTECSCGGRLRKVFSAVGVVFKGSGFYRTDSRNDAKRSPTRTAEPAKAAGDGGSSASSGSGSSDSGSSGSGSGSGSSGSSSPGDGKSSSPGSSGKAKPAAKVA